MERANVDAPLHAAVKRIQPEDWNHIAAVAINYFAYNLIKIHSTLRVSPAMAAGVTTLFDVSDLVAMLVESESKKRRSC